MQDKMLISCVLNPDIRVQLIPCIVQKTHRVHCIIQYLLLCVCVQTIMRCCCVCNCWVCGSCSGQGMKLEKDMKAKKLQQIEEDRRMAEDTQEREVYSCTLCVYSSFLVCVCVCECALLFLLCVSCESVFQVFSCCIINYAVLCCVLQGEERQVKRTEKQEREKERLQQLREAEEKEKQLSKEPEPVSIYTSPPPPPRLSLSLLRAFATASSHVFQWKPSHNGPAAMATVLKPHPTLLSVPAHHNTSPSQCAPPESCNDTQTSELNSTFTIDTAATTATTTTISTVELTFL